MKGKYVPGFELEFKYPIGQELINRQSGAIIEVVGMEIRPYSEPIAIARFMAADPIVTGKLKF